MLAENPENIPGCVCARLCQTQIFYLCDHFIGRVYSFHIVRSFSPLKICIACSVVALPSSLQPLQLQPSDSLQVG